MFAGEGEVEGMRRDMIPANAELHEFTLARNKQSVPGVS
jgi:hypothetical protein